MKVQAMFGDASWVKPDKRSAELLKHEQGHYNLALLFASEFKRTVDSTTFFIHDHHEKIKALFAAFMEKYKAMQLQYDEETNHMLNRKKQKMWNEKIEELLKQEGIILLQEGAES
jgi:predicted secreted Zn-dependent protease